MILFFGMVFDATRGFPGEGPMTGDDVVHDLDNPDADLIEESLDDMPVMEHDMLPDQGLDLLPRAAVKSSTSPSTRRAPAPRWDLCPLAMRDARDAAAGCGLFVPKPAFEGAREGFAFKMGDFGI